MVVVVFCLFVVVCELMLIFLCSLMIGRGKPTDSIAAVSKLIEIIVLLCSFGWLVGRLYFAYSSSSLFLYFSTSNVLFYQGFKESLILSWCEFFHFLSGPYHVPIARLLHEVENQR